MTKEGNHQPQVSLETPPEEDQVKEAAATAEELPINVNSETLSQIIENSNKNYLNALRSFIFLTIDWKFAEFSQRK